MKEEIYENCKPQPIYGEIFAGNRGRQWNGSESKGGLKDSSISNILYKA